MHIPPSSIPECSSFLEVRLKIPSLILGCVTSDRTLHLLEPPGLDHILVPGLLGSHEAVGQVLGAYGYSVGHVATAGPSPHSSPLWSPDWAEC